MVFMCSLWYCCWMFRNKHVHSAPMEMRAMVSVFNHIAEDFMERSEHVEDLDPISEERWTPLPLGWLKANINAAYKGGDAALGLVIRNDRGDAVLISSKLCKCMSVLEAELQALL